MAYTDFDPTVPDAVTQAGSAVVASVQANQNALVDALAAGTLPDWDLFSVTTPALPTEFKYRYRLDTDQQLKVAITYNGDNDPLTFTYSRSTDGGANWDTIGTKTVTWSSGVPTATTWS